MRALALTALVCIVTGELIQVQIIHRHGAREPLKKHSYNTSDEATSAPLFPNGAEQLSELGRYIRGTYIDTENNIRGISKKEATRGDIEAFSSNLRRTLVSSAGFLKQVYPNQDNFEIIPSMVFGKTENDWVLRGYAICPKLVKRFKEFLESDEFKKKQNENGNDEFVRRLAETVDVEGGLENIFNVYDKYKVIRNEGYGKENWKAPKDALELNDEEFKRLEDLADWYESTKYNFALHNIHVAGGLLRQIRTRMQDKIADTAERSPRRIIEYSAHYPTILSLWATLRARNSNGLEYPANSIPGFGAALIFELHKESDGNHYVRMKWWRGDWKQGETIEPEAVAIGRGQCSEANKEKGCKFEDLDRLVAVEDLGLEQFCLDCESNSQVCRAFATESSEGVISETEGKVENSQGNLASGGIGAVLGLFIGLGVALGYMTCVARKKRRGMQYGSGSFEESGEGDGDVQA